MMARLFRLAFGIEVLLLAGLIEPFSALVPPIVERSDSSSSSRRSFFQRTIKSSASVAAAATLLLGTGSTGTQPANAAADIESTKKLGLTDEELAKIVKSDVLDKQFLVTGDITRSIYQPTATFTDEIDTYGLDQWVKGTQRLFVGSKSDVRLVGDVTVSPEKIEFRFDEDLCFNIPFKPVVSLSGKVVLDRDSDSGYITAYREFWDQDVATVLKSAKF